MSTTSSALLSQSPIPLLEEVVDFAQTRHTVLTGNIANLDTPGYRVRDLDEKAFESRLKEAVAARNVSRTSAGMRQSVMADRALQDVATEASGILYHDDSNGTLEFQITEVAKNQMRHNVALAIMANQFRLLQAAISERL
jgi:flagellar basal-body rod protein FlgB